MISAGFMTRRALKLVDLLGADGVAVLHGPTIKPLDEAIILAKVDRKARLMVVAENHCVIGGLREAVASTLLQQDVQPAGVRGLRRCLAGLREARTTAWP